MGVTLPADLTERDPAGGEARGGVVVVFRRPRAPEARCSKTLGIRGREERVGWEEEEEGPPVVGATDACDTILTV